MELKLEKEYDPAKHDIDQVTILPHPPVDSPIGWDARGGTCEYTRANAVAPVL